MLLKSSKQLEEKYSTISNIDYGYNVDYEINYRLSSLCSEGNFLTEIQSQFIKDLLGSRIINSVFPRQGGLSTAIILYAMVMFQKVWCDPKNDFNKNILIIYPNNHELKHVVNHLFKKYEKNILNLDMVIQLYRNSNNQQDPLTRDLNIYMDYENSQFLTTNALRMYPKSCIIMRTISECKEELMRELVRGSLGVNSIIFDNYSDELRNEILSLPTIHKSVKQLVFARNNDRD